MAKGTRGTTNTAFSDLVGPAKNLSLTDLGTKRNVLQQALQLRFEDARDVRNYPKADVIKDTVKLVRANWERANRQVSEFPITISDNEIVRRITNLWNQAEGFSGKGGRGNKNKKKSEVIKKEKEDFVVGLDKLFDILFCQCDIKTCEEFKCTKMDKCKFKAHITCPCLKQYKIPVIELVFIRDQRLKVGTKGLHQISGVDEEESLRQIHCAEGQEERRNYGAGSTTINPATEGQVHDIDDDNNNVEVDNNNDTDWGNIEKKTEKQNRAKLTETVKAGMRFGISSRGMATLATCTLIDMGIVNKKDPHLIIDHNKIEREKSRVMEELRKLSSEKLKKSKAECFFFDGKKDKAKVLLEVEDSDKVYMGIQKEEHVSLCLEPGGDYLHHFTPGESTKDMPAAKVVALEIFQFLKESKQDGNILALGGDSTNVNTGYKGGSIHFLEVYLGRRLVWIICFLHTNELPLRHLIIVLDGPTNSDNTFSGILGRALQNVEDSEYNPTFKSIELGPGLPDLSQEVIDDLSTDQQYGYNMVQCIRDGKVPQQILLLAIGKISHARWLTTANRFLRLWVSKHNFKGKDLKNLEMIVEFIVAVYYPMWFEAKIKHHLSNGPSLVLKQMNLINHYTKPAVKRIVLPYVNSSAWFAHPEHILLAMLASEDEEERHFAVRKIMQIRGEQDQGDNGIRTFKVPAISWSASKIGNLIDWDDTPVTESAVTAIMPSENIRACLSTPLELPAWPCHGQSIERTVKKVSEASLHVAGFEKRDGWIRAADESRKKLPKMESKKDFLSMLI